MSVLPGGLENPCQVRALDLAGGHVGELGPRHRQIDNLVDPAAIGAELADPAMPGEIGDSLLRSRRASVPSASASASTCSGARGRIASIVRGSSAA